MAVMGFARHVSIAFPVIGIGAGGMDLVIRCPFLGAIRIANISGQMI